MWLVQYTGTVAENTDAVMTFLKAKNIPFAPVGIRPFTTEIMGLEWASSGCVLRLLDVQRDGVEGMPRQQDGEQFHVLPNQPTTP